MYEQYSSGLLTPKQRLLETDPGLQRELLLQSQQLRTIAADYRQSPRLFEDKIEAAENIGSLVRKSLDFATTGDLTPEFNADSLAEREAANCFGYTIVASECLDKVGVKHLIAYANQHAFVIIPDRKSDRLFMLDTPTKELCCEITNAIGGKDPLSQLELGELRAINSLYTNEVLKKLPSEIDRERFVYSRPWLNFSSSDLRTQDNPYSSILQLISLPSIPGRKLLEMEYNAQIFRRQHRPEEAAGLIADLSGIYLDVDSRNNLEEADRLCRQLISAGMGGEAIKVATVVDESLVEGDRSKNIFFLPDIMRKAASARKVAGAREAASARKAENIADDIKLMEEAIELYQQLPPSKLRAGKLAKAHKLLNMLKSRM